MNAYQYNNQRWQNAERNQTNYLVPWRFG